MTERDATWWVVTERVGGNLELAELLHRYLVGVDDFVTVALDAMETLQADVAEAASEAEAEAMVAEDSPAHTAATAALTALKEGASSEKVVFDLLRALVNPLEVEAVLKIRTRAHVRQIRKQLTARREELRECATDIEPLEKQLAELNPG